MNQEDSSTSENKPCSSKVNDNNQTMLGNTVEMLHEHKKIEIKTVVFETKELNKIDKKKVKMYQTYKQWNKIAHYFFFKHD